MNKIRTLSDAEIVCRLIERGLYLTCYNKDIKIIFYYDKAQYYRVVNGRETGVARMGFIGRLFHARKHINKSGIMSATKDYTIEDSIEITRNLYIEEISSLVYEYRQEGVDGKELYYFIAEVIRIRDKYKEVQ